MPTYLDTVHLGPDVVGVMDHPVRQPQQPLFDGLQKGLSHGLLPRWSSRLSGQDIAYFRVGVANEAANR
jgi:hypothetical protein